MNSNLTKIIILFLSIVLTSCGQAKNTEQPDTSSPYRTIAPLASTGASIETEADLEKISTTYASDIVAGLILPVWEEFTPELANIMPEENLKTAWENQVTNLDGYKGIENTSLVKENGSDIVTVTLRFAGCHGRTITFTYNEDLKISNITFDQVTLANETSVSSAALGESKEADSKTIKNDDYKEENIKIGKNSNKLTGRLVLPASSNHSKIVLLLGDGIDIDFNGTVGLAKNTPLRDLAYGLAKNGVASIRFNCKRFEYQSKTSKNASIYTDYIQEILNAIEYGRQLKNLDNKKVFIVAMGMAANYLPAIVKKKNTKLAGAVLMAAKPVHIYENFLESNGENFDSNSKYFMDENSTFPLLILQGESDFETSNKDFEKWKKIFKGRSHVYYHSFDKLNHYFMPTTGSKSSIDYDRANNINSQVIVKISDFIYKDGL